VGASSARATRSRITPALFNIANSIPPREAWSAGLGETAAGADELQALLKPFPAERMRVYSISSRVNSFKNDDAALIEPMMASGGVRV
jgi:putative SOS response-associated peptidase YedK